MLSKLKTPETKPFYLTSEFWLLVIAALNTVVISNPTDTKSLVTDGLAAAYGLARGLAKSGSSAEPTSEAAPVTDLPQAGTSDIPPLFPPADGAGVKGVDAPAAPDVPVAAKTPVAAAVKDLATGLSMVRELLTEHPEILQQLKTEGVIS